MTNETLRRQALYDYLISRGDNWTSQREIVQTLSAFYEPKIGEEGRAFHQSTARRVLTSDINFINRDSNYQKVIISNSNGVKIATRDECIQQLSRLYSANMRRLCYAKILREKAGLDGQYTLDERKIIESFVERNFGGDK